MEKKSYLSSCDTERQKFTLSNKIRRQPSVTRGYKVGDPLWQMNTSIPAATT